MREALLSFRDANSWRVELGQMKVPAIRTCAVALAVWCCATSAAASDWACAWKNLSPASQDNAQAAVLATIEGSPARTFPVFTDMERALEVCGLAPSDDTTTLKAALPAMMEAAARTVLVDQYGMSPNQLDIAWKALRPQQPAEIRARSIELLHGKVSIDQFLNDPMSQNAFTTDTALLYSDDGEDKRVATTRYGLAVWYAVYRSWREAAEAGMPIDLGSPRSSH